MTWSTVSGSSVNTRSDVTITNEANGDFFEFGMNLEWFKLCEKSENWSPESNVIKIDINETSI